ncbi:MAG: flagellar hook-length control protein FliK [Pseudomonadales bacterium]|nr:flagellar hook-length control protein FliK [Pseudomonadales bacterium]
MDRVFISKVVMPELDLLKITAGKTQLSQSNGQGNGFQREFDRQVNHVESKKAPVELHKQPPPKTEKPAPKEIVERQDSANNGQSVSQESKTAKADASGDASENAEENAGNGTDTDTTDSAEEEATGAGEGLAKASELGELSEDELVDVFSLGTTLLAGEEVVFTPEEIESLLDDSMEVSPEEMSEVAALSAGMLFSEELKGIQDAAKKTVAAEARVVVGDDVKVKAEGVQSLENLQSNKSKLFDQLLGQSSNDGLMSLQEDGKGKKGGFDLKISTKSDGGLQAMGDVKGEASKKLAAQAPLSTQLATPLAKPNWGAAFNQRIMWMVNSKVQAAEIQIYPPDLGPIKIKLQVNNDQVQVQFVAQNGMVKEALDQTLPKLREMFEQEGMNLVDVDVKDNSQQSEDDDEEGVFASGNDGDLSDDQNEAEGTVIETAVSSNLVDHFV